MHCRWCACSVAPGSVRQWFSVQLLPVLSPLRQVFIHERHEAFIVVSLNQMHEFMDNDVFEALDRLFGQFEIQPDAARLGVASAPSGFHSLDSPLRELNT